MAAQAGLPVAGLFLILEGEADFITGQFGQEKAINTTCSLYPDSRLEFKTFANVTHVPVMYACQCVWLDWIRDNVDSQGLKRDYMEKGQTRRGNTYGIKTTRGEDYTERGIHKEETTREGDYTRGNYTRRGHTEEEREKKRTIGKKRKKKERKKEREKKERRRKKGNNF